MMMVGQQQEVLLYDKLLSYESAARAPAQQHGPAQPKSCSHIQQHNR